MTPDIKSPSMEMLENWNKSHLIERIVEREGCSKKEASEMLELWVRIIESGLIEHKKILLSGFGTFQISHRKSFVGYDPMNDVEIVVPIRHVPVFKASRLLKNRLNPSQ
mgnify:CR=1 FL=1